MSNFAIISTTRDRKTQFLIQPFEAHQDADVRQQFENALKAAGLRFSELSDGERALHQEEKQTPRDAALSPAVEQQI